MATTVYCVSYDTKHGSTANVFLTEAKAKEDVVLMAQEFIRTDKEINTFEDVVQITEDMGVDCEFGYNIEVKILIEKTEDKEQEHKAELISMAKRYAIGTFTSNGEDENDYDSLMNCNSLDEVELSIWEPFEREDLEGIKELVEAEHDSALNFLTRAYTLGVNAGKENK